jgi:hypothetical protein
MKAFKLKRVYLGLRILLWDVTGQQDEGLILHVYNVEKYKKVLKHQTCFHEQL